MQAVLDASSTRCSAACAGLHMDNHRCIQVHGGKSRSYQRQRQLQGLQWRRRHNLTCILHSIHHWSCPNYFPRQRCARLPHRLDHFRRAEPQSRVHQRKLQGLRNCWSYDDAYILCPAGNQRWPRVAHLAHRLDLFRRAECQCRFHQRKLRGMGWWLSHLDTRIFCSEC